MHHVPSVLTPEPHTDCHVDDYKCCYESNAERERNAGVCRGWRDMCVLPIKHPRIGWSGIGLRAVEGVTSERCATFFFQGSKSFRSIVWLGAMTTTRALLRSLYPADPSSCVTSSVCVKPTSRRVLWHAGAVKTQPPGWLGRSLKALDYVIPTVFLGSS